MTEHGANLISDRKRARLHGAAAVIAALILALCPISAFATDIDYNAMRTDPIEDAFKKLTENEIPEWDIGYITGGDIDDSLDQLKWPLKTGYLRGRFNRRASKGRRRHDGIDLIAPRGTPIYAALDGVVEVISSGTGMFRGYGKVVFINHKDELWSLYAHCNTIQVKMGQKVKRGEQIATVGRTGRATTDHLHFELRNKSGTPLNPMNYLPEEGALPSR